MPQREVLEPAIQQIVYCAGVIGMLRNPRRIIQSEFIDRSRASANMVTARLCFPFAYFLLDLRQEHQLDRMYPRCDEHFFASL
jgi:hypothetical protein